MEHIIGLDTSLLLAINGWHSPIADKIMLFFSAIPVWIPLYVIVAALMFWPRWQTLKSERIPVWMTALFCIIAIAICFGFCDQASSFIKESVQRFRPGHEPSLEGLVRLLEGKGGSYGFVSGHAANTFGLATLTSLIFRKKWYSIFIFLWAVTISYSRIYLAKHYPLDVICGALLGAAIGLLVYYILKLSLHKYEMYRRQRA
ncbi:MAG: phosphatase PAP2 family protein [Bacteroidales bacterium]|nr:phosphatase PAP2 family protein [Bacteroidales bacterium]